MNKTHNIVDGLLVLAVPIGKLRLDPKNARVHPDRNIASIKESLQRFGQRRPVVVNSISGIVLAGNGVLTAARDLGWTQIAALYVDDDPATASGYAIADNRTQETSFFDPDTLRDLIAELEIKDPELIVGFSQEEVDEIMGRIKAPEPDEKSDGEDDDQEPTDTEEPLEPSVKVVTLYIPADQYDTFLADVEALAKNFQTDDISQTILIAVERMSKP